MEVLRTIIIPREVVTLAKQLATDVLAELGDGMWDAKLSTTGLLPETHYISSGVVDERLLTALESSPFYSDVYIGEDLTTALQTLGLSKIHTSILNTPVKLITSTDFTTKVNVECELLLEAAYGDWNHEFYIWFNTLPPGLSLIGNRITGTPTLVGSYEIGIAVSSKSTTDTELITITIE